jgi:hypothetical protein
MSIESDSSAGNKADGQTLSSDREAGVLPLVLRIRERIDEVFARYVGPISSDLSVDEFERWRAQGQVRPRGLSQYIGRLARYIPQVTQRQAFIADAAKCIRVTIQESGAGGVRVAD